MKRILQIFVVVFAIVFLAAAGYLESQMPKITLTEPKVQEKLESMFPVEGQKIVLKYSFSNPVINFLPDGFVSLAADVILITPKKESKGKVKIQAKPIYKSGIGEIYLESPKVKRLEWEKKEINDKSSNSLIGSLKEKIREKVPTIESSVTESVPLIKQVIKDKADDYFRSKPIYTLKDDGGIQKSIKLHVTDIRLQEEGLKISLSWATVEKRLFVYLGFIMILSVLGSFAFRKTK